MKMNYKHLGLYVLAGIVSGSLSIAVMGPLDWIGLPEAAFVAIPIMLAAAIYTVGRYLGDTNLRHTWFSPVALVVACFAGLYLAVRLVMSCIAIFGVGGCVFVEFWGIVVSGGIVGICVAIGVALAWKLNRAGLVITITTVAGLLGGLAFQFGPVDDPLNHPDLGVLWAVAAFIILQAILLLGIGIAVQIDSAKSSAEQ